ncbi:hypothetical protein B0H14DRAFT_2556776 [Mycena olivaceomarginata]|nr:hypothetical protein B0H14DRAFT_2556776 [Mycena olivaceomarginata]
MMFKALPALVLAASLLGAAVASPTSELEAGLESRQSCGASNNACGSALPACCSGLFCNTLNGGARAPEAPARLASPAAPGTPAAPCLADAVKLPRFIVIRLPSASTETTFKRTNLTRLQSDLPASFTTHSTDHSVYYSSTHHALALAVSNFVKTGMPFVTF